MKSESTLLTQQSPGVSRRTVAKGMAWSLPVIALASAAPALAASGCQSEPVTINPNGGTPEQIFLNGVLVGQRFSASATDTNSNTTYYRITAQTAGTSATVFKNNSGSSAPNNTEQSYNMTIGNSGIQGGTDNSGSGDVLFTGFSPGGVKTLVMNQRGLQTPNNSTYASPSQTMTLTFESSASAAGPWTSFNPGTATIDIFDISSVGPSDSGGTNVRNNYWDAVGFARPDGTNLAPTSITLISSPSPSSSYQGTGAGTKGNPYRRSRGDAATVSGSYINDRFTFNSGFPSGGSLTYSSYGGRGGWQFISILTVTFTTSTVCP